MKSCPTPSPEPTPVAHEGVRLVALAGYAGAGKDEAALALLAEGWQRRCFGDIIKDLFDPLVREHLGFSAHTGDRLQKARIRELLVHGGEAFYDVVSRRFFQQVDFLLSLGHRVVNTRLCRPPEARAWVARGGIILEVRRPGCRPAEPKEAEWLEEIRGLRLLAGTLVNDGTTADLHAQLRQAVAGVNRRLQP